MNISCETIDNTGRISLHDTFGASQFRALKDHVSSMLSKDCVSQIEINLSKVHALDSTSLGALLFIRSEMTGKGKSLKITGVRDKLYGVLESAHFEREFCIERISGEAP